MLWQLTGDAAGEGRADGGEAAGADEDAGWACDGDGAAAGGAAPLHEHTVSAGSKTAAAAAIAIFDTTPTGECWPAAVRQRDKRAPALTVGPVGQSSGLRPRGTAGLRRPGG